MLVLNHDSGRTPGDRFDRWWRASDDGPRYYPLVLVDGGVHAWAPDAPRLPTGLPDTFRRQIGDAAGRTPYVAIDATWERLAATRLSVTATITNTTIRPLAGSQDLSVVLFAVDQPGMRSGDAMRYVFHSSTLRVPQGLAPGEARTVTTILEHLDAADLFRSDIVVAAEMRRGGARSAYFLLQAAIARPLHTISPSPTPRPTSTVRPSATPAPSATTRPDATAPPPGWTPPPSPMAGPTAQPTSDLSTWLPTLSAMAGGRPRWQALATAEAEGGPLYVMAIDVIESNWPIRAFRDRPGASAAGAVIPLIRAERLRTSIGGLAWDEPRRRLYLAAGHTDVWDMTHFGHIWAWDALSDTLTVLARLPAVGATITNPWEVWSKHVGLSGLGDIDIDADAATLFAVNLLDRRIYRIGLPDGAVLGSFANGAAAEPWGAAHARPYALAWHDGWLYHSVVADDGLGPVSSPNQPARVYRSRSDGSLMAEVLAFDLRYPRFPVWGRWLDVPDRETRVRSRRNQPWIVDLAFTAAGDMAVGLRDRAIDQTWSLGYGPEGDLLLARRQAADRWTIDPSQEWYADDDPHTESITGYLAAVPNADAVVASTSGQPVSRGHHRAAVWLDHATGRVKGPFDGRGNLVVADEEQVADGGDIEPIFLHLPTVTPRIPTPTQTHTPTTTAEPTLTFADRPTPRPVPQIYLPGVYRHTCPAPPPVDVALALDTSSSMAGAKLDDARRAVLAMADALRPADRLAVVAFDSVARPVSTLGDDRSALATALDALTTSPGTRLDAGLRGARAALAGRRPEARTAVVLVTDGRQAAEPETALAAAAELRADGTAMWAVGIGVDADGGMLAALTGDVGRVWADVEAGALSAVLGGLAGELGCP